MKQGGRWSPREAGDEWTYEDGPGHATDLAVGRFAVAATRVHATETRSPLINRSEEPKADGCPPGAAFGP